MIIINTPNARVELSRTFFVSVIHFLYRSCLLAEENVVLDSGGLRKYRHGWSIIAPES